MLSDFLRDLRLEQIQFDTISFAFIRHAIGQLVRYLERHRPVGFSPIWGRLDALVAAFPVPDGQFAPSYAANLLLSQFQFSTEIPFVRQIFDDTMTLIFCWFVVRPERTVDVRLDERLRCMAVMFIVTRTTCWKLILIKNRR